MTRNDKRCWCGASGSHEHLCGGGMGVHPGYLLPLWHLFKRLLSRGNQGRRAG